MKPQRRSVSICTKISDVSGPRVRKPNPRNRLNHFTTTLSQSLSGTTTTWVRCGNCDGRIAVELSMLQMRTACRPFGTPHDFADHPCALGGGLEAAVSEAGHMQENVGKVLIRNDKPVAL